MTFQSMPKDWATHKAEVERLYIEEGRTLNEVRNILRRRHGFDASTRAYRMRFETWEIRKNKRKERSSHENSPDLATNSGTATGPDLKISLPPASKIDEAFVQYGPFMIPQRPMNADDVLSLMKGPSAGFYALEILLRKWQPGGEYLDILTTYLQTVKDFEGIIRNSDEGGPLLFKLIEERVPSEEQFDVGKLLLETHFLSRHKPQPHDSPWLLVWIAATRTTEWEDAKEILYEGNRVACLAGNLFLDCALIVIAEQMLKRYIKQFRAFKVHNGRLSRSMLADADWCRRKYLHIFKDSNCLRDMPLRPLFYRYSLEIIETQVEITDCPHDVDCIELANDCRQKYLKLTSSPMDTHAISDAVDDLLRDVEESDWIEDSTSNTPAFGPMMLSSEPQSAVTNTSQSFSAAESSQNHYLDDHQWISDRLGENNMPGRDPRVSSSRNIIEVLIRRWKSLKGFNSYVHSLLLNDGSDISIFDPHDNNNNLFDLIRTQTPQSEQLSLTKAVLIAFSTINIDLCWRPWTLSWWLSLFTSTSWPQFQTRLDPEKVQLHLGRVMSVAAVDLLVNATVFLVGERLLLGLKNKMIANPGWRARANDKFMSYHKNFQQYMAILQDFETRGLSVDQSWRSHALNTM